MAPRPASVAGLAETEANPPARAEIPERVPGASAARPRFGAKGPGDQGRAGYAPRNDTVRTVAPSRRTSAGPRPCASRPDRVEAWRAELANSEDDRAHSCGQPAYGPGPTASCGSVGYSALPPTIGFVPHKRAVD